MFIQESLAIDPSSVVIDGEQREHLARILHSGKLYAVFNKSSDLRNPSDPPFEVDLISHIDVAKYIVSYKLIEDVEQVKKEYEAEAKFFLPEDDKGAKPPSNAKSEQMASPSRTLPPQKGAEKGADANIKYWSRTPVVSSKFEDIEQLQTDDPPVSSQFKGSYPSSHDIFLLNQFEGDHRFKSPAHHRYA